MQHYDLGKCNNLKRCGWNRGRNIQRRNPQTERSISSASNSITPCPICPPFNVLKASVARLKLDPAPSTAIIINDAPVLLVNLQHPPQLGELNTTPGTPPIKGKVGTLPNVGNSVARPLAPCEHATLLSEPLGLSYEASNVARTVVPRVVCSANGRA